MQINNLQLKTTIFIKYCNIKYYYKYYNIYYLHIYYHTIIRLLNCKIYLKKIKYINEL